MIPRIRASRGWLTAFLALTTVLTAAGAAHAECVTASTDRVEKHVSGVADASGHACASTRGVRMTLEEVDVTHRHAHVHADGATIVIDHIGAGIVIDHIGAGVVAGDRDVSVTHGGTRARVPVLP